MVAAGRRRGSMSADREAHRPPRQGQTRRTQGLNAPRVASRSHVDAFGVWTRRCGASTRGQSRPRRRRAGPADGPPGRAVSSTRSSGAPAIPRRVLRRSCLPRAGVADGRGGRVHAAKRTPVREWLHTESNSSAHDASIPRHTGYRSVCRAQPVVRVRHKAGVDAEPQHAVADDLYETVRTRNELC